MKQKNPAKKLEPGSIPRTYLVIGIIITIILLLVSIYLFIQSISAPLSRLNSNVTEFDEGVGSITDSGQPKTQGTEECFKSRGFESVLIYLYLPTCPYSQQMTPVIDNLISRGYLIRKVDASNTKNYVDMAGCTTIRAVVPQYICTLNGKVLEGSVSEEELTQFYSDCRPSK
jgi:hypothetical protein